MLTAAPVNAPDGQPFRIITLRNAGGMTVTLMDWGATLLTCRVPMPHGSLRECLLGCPGPSDYLHQQAYLGASIGRYANRIAGARFSLDAKAVQLQPSQGKNLLHGGPEGFDKRRWRTVRHGEHEVLYSLISPDGDQGFPGELRATAHFHLTDDNGLRITYRAQVDQPCPVNLTNHAYFNLNGTQSDVRQHLLQLCASRWLPVDAEGIPLGELAPVAGSSFDFRARKRIAQDFMCDEAQRRANGYDHAFLFDQPGKPDAPVARLWSDDASLEMQMFTTAPALQFYTGNYLNGTPARCQGDYQAWQGLALESQFLPDSPNHPQWPQPDCLVRPGSDYSSVTEYRFVVL